MPESASRPIRRRRSPRHLPAALMAVPPLLLGGLLIPTLNAWVASPLDDVSPSADGLPGAALFRQILAWGFWLALGVCGLAILYGAATWRGMNGNSGRGVEG